jgi:hypothetical protein
MGGHGLGPSPPPPFAAPLAVAMTLRVSDWPDEQSSGVRRDGSFLADTTENRSLPTRGSRVDGAKGQSWGGRPRGDPLPLPPSARLQRLWLGWDGPSSRWSRSHSPTLVRSTGRVSQGDGRPLPPTRPQRRLWLGWDGLDGSRRRPPVGEVVRSNGGHDDG